MNAFGKGVPLYFKKAKGPYLWDIDGNRFIDYAASLGPIILGYCHTAVDNAVKRQIDRGIIYSMPAELELELARLLVEVIPCAEMVRFLKTGGAAMDAAVRIARACTGREEILSSGYHGWHDVFMGTEKTWNRGIPRSMTRHTHTFGSGDLESATRIMKRRGEKIACIAVNPFAGWDIPTKSHLRGLLRLANKYGALLILDEVKTGFRLALGGAQERYGICPHLTVLAKAMANGYPISAVAGKRKIMQVFDDESAPRIAVTNTLAGDLVGIVAAIATIKVLKKPSTYRNLYRTGELLKKGLNSIFTEHGIEGEARGEPTYFLTRIQGVSGRKREPLGKIFIRELLSSGIYCRGEWDIMLAHDKEIVWRTLDIVDKACRRIVSGR